MIGDILVIDGVTHTFGIDPEAPKEVLDVIAPSVWKMVHIGMGSRDPKYLLTQEQWFRNRTPEEYIGCLFAESQTDIAVFHDNVLGAIAPYLGSPIADARAAKEIVGKERILTYGSVQNVLRDTKQAIDRIDQLIEEDDIIGLKFFPTIWDGQRMFDVLLDDEDMMYPLIEHAQKRGLKAIAFHKAMGYLTAGVGIADMAKPAQDFPTMNFEIVHGGMAFLEDTLLVFGQPNIYVNLEATSGYLAFAPRKMAEVLGMLCRGVAQEGGGEDRIIWSSAACFVHPQPLLDLFMDFEMPRDMVEGYGYPAITLDIKRKILGENFARMHGLDVETLKNSIPNDEMRQRQVAGDFDPPWSKVPALVG